MSYHYLVDADAGNRGRLYDGTDAADAMAAWSKAISRGVGYVTLEALRNVPIPAARRAASETAQPVTAQNGTEAECAFCTTHIIIIDGEWWADDGTLACTDTSAPFVPHKPAED